MALVYIEGFESYFSDVGEVTTELTNARYLQYSTTYSVSGYWGGYGVSSDNAIYSPSNSFNCIKYPSNSVGTLVVGFRYKSQNTTSSYNTFYINRYDQNNNAYSLLQVAVSVNSIYTSISMNDVYIDFYIPYLLNDEQWHYIETKLRPNINNSGRVDIITKVDNIIMNQYLNRSLGNSVLCSGTQWYMAKQGADYGYEIDDIYIADGNPVDRYGNSGAITDFIPNAWRCRVQQMMPNSDVVKEFTPNIGAYNHEVLDEVPYNTTDFVSSTSVGQQDVYGYGELAGTGRANIFGNIYGVMMQPTTRLAMGASGVLIPVINNCSISGLAINVTSAEYRQFNRVIEKNPATSGLWTFNSVSGISAGLKLDKHFWV